MSLLGTKAFECTGLPRKKALFWGGMLGFIIMTPIEIFDGFSAAYGASWADIAANTLGSGMVIGQYALWDEIRIHPKFSFQTSPYASIRPNTLGSNLREQLLKDYNGQTYWFSFETRKFLKTDQKWLQYINLAVGYGAQEMVYARDNENTEAGFNAYRQWYLGLDFNTKAIKTKSKFLQSFLYVLNTIKIPAPTLEYNSRAGFKAYWLFF